ncbi:MAG: VCBS repeat-containing protein, partial [Thermoplasmata archaeon]|nr:VCBS repeat-containing protein [Thermoplasmata archaeon]
MPAPTPTVSITLGSDRGKDAADLDLDGNIDLVVGSTNANIWYFKGRGDGTFDPCQSAVVAPATTQYGLTVADYDGDNIPDLLEAQSSTGNIHFHKGLGDCTFDTNWLNFSVYNYYAILDNYDFNRDGQQDVIVAETDAGANSNIEYWQTNGQTPGVFISNVAVLPQALWGLSAPTRVTDYFEFNTLPPTPTGMTDLGNRLTDHFPAVGCNIMTDPDGDPITYNIEVSTDGVGWVTQASGYGGTSITLDAIKWLDGSDGYWRVRTHDGYEYSGWTANDFFHFNAIPDSPTGATVLDNKHVIDHTPTVSWNNMIDPDGDTVWYTVQSSRNGGAWSNEVVNTLSTSETLDALSWMDGDYGYWRVRAYDGYEYTGWHHGDTNLVDQNLGEDDDNSNWYNPIGTTDLYLSDLDGLIVDAVTEADGISMFTTTNGYFTFDVSGHIGEAMELEVWAEIFQGAPARWKELTVYGGTAINSFDKIFYSQEYLIDPNGGHITFSDIPITGAIYYIKLAHTGGDLTNSIAFDSYNITFSNDGDLFAMNDAPEMPTGMTDLTLGGPAPTVSWVASVNDDYGTDDTIEYFVYYQDDSGVWVQEFDVGGPTANGGSTYATSIDLDDINWFASEWGRWYVVAYDGYEFSDDGYVITSNDAGNRYYTGSNGDGTFQDYVDLGGGSGTRIRGTGIGDFDNDGDFDYVFNSWNGVLEVHLWYVEKIGPGDQFAVPVDLGMFYNAGNMYAMDMVVADFNNDNNMDLAACGNNASTYIFLGNGAGGFTLTSIINVPVSMQRGKDAADFDLDGYMDIVMGSNTNDLYLFKGNGDGTFQSMGVVITVSGTYQHGVTAGDFNNDGRPDILAKNGSVNGRVYFYQGNGDCTFQPGVLAFTIAVGYGSLDSYDIDHDGNLDVIANEQGTGRTKFLPGLGNGGFGAWSYVLQTGTGSYYGIST